MNGADVTPLVPIHLLRDPEPSVEVPPSLAADDPTYLARGMREPRPTKRRSVTHGLDLAGHSVHIGLSKRPDGTVFEFFVDLHKEGAPLRGAAHVVAASNSASLQRGTSLRVVCNSLRSSFFEPAGTVTGHERITHADSLFDLVAQVLEDEDAVLREELARERAEKARGQ